MPTRLLSRKVLGKGALMLCCLLLLSATHAQNNYYVNAATGSDANAGTIGNPFATIQKAVNVSVANDIVHVAAGSYNEYVTVNKSLTIEGADSATTILNNSTPDTYSATGGTGFAVTANNVSIKNFKVRNYNFGVSNPVGISNLSIDMCALVENFGAGYYSNQHVLGISITNSNLSYNGNKNNVGSASSFKRGIMLQSTAANISDVVFTGNVVEYNGLVGIDINTMLSIDGVNISNNTLRYNVDAQLSLWLGASTPSSKAVLVNNNQMVVSGSGRFGVEVKNPGGNGKSSGIGSVVISNNNVSVVAHTGASRDIGAIVVIRRKDDLTTINDQPQGVVITGNTIADFQNSGAGDAYGIVVGGTGHYIANNTITNTEYSIQLQKGNDGYLTNSNSDQALNNAFFSRDNSKDVCAEVGTNTITSSGAPRLVTGVATTTLVLPTLNTQNNTLGTKFCTLQQAIDFTATVTGHTVGITAATLDEQVTINKSITVDGVDASSHIATFTGTVPAGNPKAIFTVTAQNVTIQNVWFNVDLTKTGSAIVSSGDVAHLKVLGNHIVATNPLGGTLLSYGTRNAISINVFGTANVTAITSTSIQDITVSRNYIDSANGVLFRAGVAVDRIDGFTVGGANVSDGNTFNASVNHDVIDRFYYGTHLMQNNQFKGGGIEISTANGAGTTTLQNNIFNGLWSKNNVWAMLRLINNTQTGRTYNINNNAFIDQKWAVSSENIRNLTLDNNQFTATVNNFRLVSINTKIRTNSASPSPLEVIDAKFINNTFSANAGFTAGNAIEFLNFDQQADNNYRKGAYVIGETGKENSFNINIPTFISLSQINGINTDDAGFLAAYPEYNDGAISTVTTTGYWVKNIDARHNKFDLGLGLQLATTFTPPQLTAISNLVFDRNDNANLGLVVFVTPTWTGAVDTDWSNTLNWSDGWVPDADLDANIPNVTNKPVLTAASICDSLVIASGSSVTLGTQTLSVYGSITNAGTINGSTGSITLAGADVQQTMNGNITVKNFTLNNNTGATITAGAGNSLKIIDTYTPSAGILTTNGNLELLSDATTTASIATGATSSYISGNVKVNRYIPGGRRVFRFFGHPFNAAMPLSILTDKIDITGAGGAANGFTTTVTNNPSAFWFNPAIGDNSTTGTNPGWVAFTSATASNWLKGQGIRVLVRGSKGQTGSLDGSTYTPDEVTFGMTGSVNMGNQTINIVSSNSGFNLVANPYPAKLDVIPALTAIAGNLGAGFWVWDANVGTRGGYSVAPISGSFVLPSGASFVVQTNANTAINFTEAHKSSGASQNIFRNGSVNNMVQLVLESSGAYWDKLYIRNDANAVPAMEQKNDALKMQNGEVNFYSLSSDQRQLSIDSRPSVNDAIIPLGLTSDKQRAFTIRVAEYGLPKEAELWLHDKLLETWTKLDKNVTYDVIVNADAASQGDNRLELVQRTIQPPIVIAPVFSVKLGPNPATDKVLVNFTNTSTAATTISVTSMDGKLMTTVNMGEVQQGQATIPVRGFAKGTYLVTLNNGTERNVQKLVIQ